MQLAAEQATQRDTPGTGRATADPMASALERLGAAGQGVIAKRIDLALLEGQELLSRTLEGVALISAGTLLAAAAWFAAAASLTLLVVPGAHLVVRLGVFGLLNGGTAAGLVALGMRRSRPQGLARPNVGVFSTPAKP